MQFCCRLLLREKNSHLNSLNNKKKKAEYKSSCAFQLSPHSTYASCHLSVSRQSLSLARVLLPPSVSLSFFLSPVPELSSTVKMILKIPALTLRREEEQGKAAVRVDSPSNLSATPAVSRATRGLFTSPSSPFVFCLLISISQEIHQMNK